MGISGVFVTFWGYGWGEETMTAYGDLEKSAVIGNFAKRAVEGAEPFSRQEGVSGGAPVAQGHCCPLGGRVLTGQGGAFQHPPCVFIR